MEDIDIKTLKRVFKTIVILFVLIIVGFAIFFISNEEPSFVEINDIPEFTDAPSIVINNNEPDFKEENYSGDSYEYYSDLDKLGRCGYAIANIGKDLMPTQPREEIGMVKPSGWHLVKYDGIDGDFLFNRCHVIGFQLTGENANPKNLITGTRYMNTQGMLPYENMVAEYIRRTDNHVLYRVTPIFEGNNLVCSGVQMEAKSVEDDGEGIKFNVYCYNVQPGVTIDYKTGESSGPEFTGKSEHKEKDERPKVPPEEGTTYVLNNNSMKFHKPECENIYDISLRNREDFKGERQELIDKGYTPCGGCNP